MFWAGFQFALGLIAALAVVVAAILWFRPLTIFRKLSAWLRSLNRRDWIFMTPVSLPLVYCGYALLVIARCFSLNRRSCH